MMSTKNKEKIIFTYSPTLYFSLEVHDNHGIRGDQEM